MYVARTLYVCCVSKNCSLFYLINTKQKILLAGNHVVLTKVLIKKRINIPCTVHKRQISQSRPKKYFSFSTFNPIHIKLFGYHSVTKSSMRAPCVGDVSAARSKTLLREYPPPSLPQPPPPSS